MDFTKWHKVAVRVQDTQSMLRIFVDDEMVSVYPFKQQIVAYPRDAQLRLAQIFEVYLENTGVITSRFKVSQYKGKLRVLSWMRDFLMPLPSYAGGILKYNNHHSFCLLFSSLNLLFGDIVVVVC